MIAHRYATPESSEVALRSTLDSYTRVVQAVEDAGSRAYPPAAEGLRNSLQELRTRLAREASPLAAEETATQLEGKLKVWSGQVAGFFDERSSELKEVLLMVAQAAGELAARDERHCAQFNHVRERLSSTLEMNDLTLIRQSLTESVAEIVAYVDQLQGESRESLAKMNDMIAGYQARLAETEMLANVDPLTGLTNRRALNADLERRITQKRPFSVIFWDLNGFKAINDRLGHAAGDALLKLVSAELRDVTRASDVVGRWGGDEFLVILDGDIRNAEKCSNKIEQWVSGPYALPSTSEDGQEERVEVRGAIGIAGWQPRDSVAALIQRADLAMYRRKAALKRRQGPLAPTQRSHEGRPRGNQPG